MKLKYCIISVFCLIGLSFSALATNTEKFILNKEVLNSFPLATSGSFIPMVVDSADYAGVLRVANNLRDDISKVTGAIPFLSKNKLHQEKQLLIIGTQGKSSLINQLIKSGKIDAAELNGKYEKYLIQTVAHPFQGIDEALVIAGSDKRGTIYGMYELSAQIGVSPWYYWADVPVKKQKDIYVIRGKYTDGEPAVKYRGIFLNDEAPALSGWSSATFGGFNHKFYEKVFELILRLKGNYLWPAMWGSAFYDDDPLNGSLADEYGIVIGTSHHEPMGKAHAEWSRYGSGAWNYDTNKDTLQKFWKAGMERLRNWESVVTIGMRGDGDEPMSEQSNIALLERIVADQRAIIENTTGKKAEETPQMWALYKEVQDYYDKGMRVPDDVTLLLCDDNWGNVRKLPELNAAPRKGGYGMYYHFDYVGGPRNYKWLNISQIQRVWEQMNLTYQYGVDKLWIVNVGDLKPMEYPISFFLDMAWNPDKFKADNLVKHTEEWCARQFGEVYAKDAARLIDLYTKYNRRVTPELLNSKTYSTINYREFDGVVKDYKQLEKEAGELYNRLPADTRDAFDQLILFPIQACANLNEMYAAQALNQLYAVQGRVSANDWAEKVKQLYERDSLLTIHYNKEIAGGKWNHMMDQTHIGYTYWQQPEKNVMPKVSFVNAPKEADMRVSVEGSQDVAALNKAEISLPAFDSFARQEYYIDLFNAGQTSFKYRLKISEKWLLVPEKQGVVSKDKRILVHINWEQLPQGKNETAIVITTKGKSITVKVEANSLQAPENIKRKTFMESNGFVSIEAEHYSKANNNDKVSWLVIPGLGKTISGVTTTPVAIAPQEDSATGVSLEYDVYLQSAGEATLKLLLSPTLNYNANKGLRYAVSIDGGAEQIVNFNEKFTEQDRDVWVANSIIGSVTKHNFTRAGLHTIKYRVIDAGIVLQKILLDMGGLKPGYLGAPESPVLEGNSAEVRLPRLIGDGMVLQRGTELKLWGWASPQEKIKLSFMDIVYHSVADNAGRWEVKLPSQNPGGPYTMTINNKEIKDILIGDVWVCSGQSNMELPVSRVLDLYKKEMDTAENSKIREFTVPLKYDFNVPAQDISGGSWQSVNPKNVLRFSAVAYFFAKDLYEKYGIPVGIIRSAVGGSPIEAWLSEEALKQFPAYLKSAEILRTDGYIDSIRTRENKTGAEWNAGLYKSDKGICGTIKWFDNDCNVSDWGTMNLPAYWSDNGSNSLNGSVWFRKTIDLPASMTGKSATLRLGCIVDCDSVFINGQFIGTTSYQYPPRIYNVPAGLLKEGTNTITIRVINYIGRGGFVKDKPYKLIVGDEEVNLSGAWKYKVGTEMKALKPITFFQYKPLGLYNSMIAPLTNYAIKGFVWYQGESNTDRYGEYESLLSSLIKDWRNKWSKASLPFIYVQLPNFMEVKKEPAESKWALLREAQLNTLKVPNTEMVVAIDLGEWNDIHPLNKKEVGRRLSLAAQHIAYGEKQVISSGPLYKSTLIKGDKMIISFTGLGGGLVSGGELKGFAISGPDNKFIWAKARIDGDKVIVWNDNIKHPVAVRYAWADNPDGANLRNMEGFPASPFRTNK